jgi:hypothetical protein
LHGAAREAPPSDDGDDAAAATVTSSCATVRPPAFADRRQGLRLAAARCWATRRRHGRRALESPRLQPAQVGDGAQTVAACASFREARMLNERIDTAGQRAPTPSSCASIFPTRSWAQSRAAFRRSGVPAFLDERYRDVALDADGVLDVAVGITLILTPLALTKVPAVSRRVPGRRLTSDRDARTGHRDRLIKRDDLQWSCGFPAARRRLIPDPEGRLGG